MAIVFLPKTDFPIRAQLPLTEPAILQKWKDENLYAQRDSSGEPFVMHDGPPYANGDIHIGHALNKILKDFVLRTRYLLGNSVTFMPGWDCHGLPIEWEVEKQFRAEGRDRNAEPEAFRQACRAYAGQWVNTQSEQFQRLGILADWDQPYQTMDYCTEAKIMTAFHSMVERGMVYSARRPVLWSPVERTSMANAEVEDKEHQVTTAWLVFPITSTRAASATFGGPAFVLVWTTTPWSLPGNMALAINPTLSYGLYDLNGYPTIMADFSAKNFEAERIMDVSPETLLECTAISPLYEEKRVPFYAADYVAEGKGSGIVHVGPASSLDDWRLWTKHNPVDTVPTFVGDDGRYVPDLPKFGGLSVTKNKGFGEANGAVLAALGDYLIRTDEQTMTLKHSWRSKALLIENATPQWFVSLDEMEGLELDGIDFYPEQTRNRFESMLGSRTEWLVSRQRMWGTPLGIYANEAGEALVDPELNQRVAQAVAERGAAAWYEEDFGAPEGYHKVTDVLDVWFDSGCVHTFYDNQVADLYLEGTDQHRGWFQSSLLVSGLTKGTTPYRALLTHGFTLDPNGKKMAKSDRNGVDPIKMAEIYGADVLRLWGASIDYTNDVRVGKDTFPAVEEVYKKLRNTLRYLLGALNGYVSDSSHLEHCETFDTYLLYRLSKLMGACEEAAREYDFTRYMTVLREFCVHDLSAFYFDVRKDRLYCDPLDDPKRLASLYVLSRVFDVVVPLLAPILAFTTEEAWQKRYPDRGSVHLERWPVRFSVDTAHSLVEKLMVDVAEYRVLLETARAGGIIKGNEMAILRGQLPAEYTLPKIIQMIKELLLVSDVVIDDLPLRAESAVEAGYVKCDRCRLYYAELKAEYCERCEEAMEDFRDD